MSRGEDEIMTKLVAQAKEIKDPHTRDQWVEDVKKIDPEIAKRIWERFMQGMIDDAERQIKQIKKDNPELATAMEKVDKIENKQEFLEQLPSEELERLREIPGVGDLMEMINL